MFMFPMASDTVVDWNVISICKANPTFVPDAAAVMFGASMAVSLDVPVEPKRTRIVLVLAADDVQMPYALIRYVVPAAMVFAGTAYDTTVVSAVVIGPTGEAIDATPPGGPPPDGARRFAAGRVPVTPVAGGIDGISPATSEHGPNDVAETHVPITLCEVCPVAAPSVRVEPEIVQVSQFAPVAEQELAPCTGGGKVNCARRSWANQMARTAHKRKRAIRGGS